MNDAVDDDVLWSSPSFEEQFVKPKPGRTLIVGSKVYPGREDRRKKHANAIGVDMLKGEGVDVVMNMENRDAISDLLMDHGTFDHIECVSVLEHSRKPWLIAQNMEVVLRPKGTLYVTVPFIWREHAYPNDYWRFTREGLLSLFPYITWKATAYMHSKLQFEGKLPATKVKGYPFFARTQVCAFGYKEGR